MPWLVVEMLWIAPVPLYCFSFGLSVLLSKTCTLELTFKIVDHNAWHPMFQLLDRGMVCSVTHYVVLLVALLGIACPEASLFLETGAYVHVLI